MPTQNVVEVGGKKEFKTESTVRQEFTDMVLQQINSNISFRPPTIF